MQGRTGHQNPSGGLVNIHSPQRTHPAAWAFSAAVRRVTPDQISSVRPAGSRISADLFDRSTTNVGRVTGHPPVAT